MNRIFYMAAVALLCTSCFHVNKNYTGGKNAIKGTGSVISKTLDRNERWRRCDLHAGRGL